jgi:hypothetical protein
MSGLLRRLTRRRPATADETGSSVPESSEPAGAPAETPAEPGGDQPVGASSEQATQVLPETGDQPAADTPTVVGGGDTATGDQTIVIPARMRDLPAGVDPSEYADAPAASAPRGKLRRRLRYLRRVRDLLLRDLGGFTYEIRRTVGGTPTESHRKLVESKLSRIEALDAEVRALEGRLDEPHETALLREPGIGGTCPECGELHSSDAHYCSRCGTPLDAKARAKRDAAVAAAVHETGSATPAPEPAPASVLWAAGPRPSAAAPEAAPEEPASEVTSRWLAVPRRAEASEPGPEPVAAEAEPDEAAPKPGVEEAGQPEGEPTPPPGETATAPTPAAEKKPAKRTRKPAAKKTADAAVEPPQPPVDEPVAEKPDTAPVADEVPADEPQAPDFTPAPNGRKNDEVREPDPLPSRQERGA